MEKIIDEVLKLFKKNYIIKYIYNGHKQNVIYHAGSGRPTYEFLDAWEFTQITKQLNILSATLFYNPKSMSFDQTTFLHGSRYSRPNDVRNNLMDILNKSGYSSSLWLSVSRSVPYWDKFIVDMFSGGELTKIINKHFKDEGFIF